MGCGGELGQQSAHAHFKAMGEIKKRKGGKFQIVMELEAPLVLNGVEHQAYGPDRLPGRDWPWGRGILSTSRLLSFVPGG